MNKFLTTIFVMLVLDSVYLSTTKNFFGKMIKSIQGQSVSLNYLGLFATYIALLASYYYFIMARNGSVFDAFILGISIYGVYELTNYTILKNWNLKAVVLDTLWGGLLFSLTRYITNKL